MFRFQLGEGYLRIFQLWECSEHALGLVLAQPSGAVQLGACVAEYGQMLRAHGGRTKTHSFALVFQWHELPAVCAAEISGRAAEETRACV